MIWVTRGRAEMLPSSFRSSMLILAGLYAWTTHTVKVSLIMELRVIFFFSTDNHAIAFYMQKLLTESKFQNLKHEYSRKRNFKQISDLISIHYNRAIPQPQWFCVSACSEDRTLQLSTCNSIPWKWVNITSLFKHIPNKQFLRDVTWDYFLADDMASLIILVRHLAEILHSLEKKNFKLPKGRHTWYTVLWRDKCKKQWSLLMVFLLTLNYLLLMKVF